MRECWICAGMMLTGFMLALLLGFYFGNLLMGV